MGLSTHDKKGNTAVKKLATLLALACLPLVAHAIPELTLQEIPPLERIKYCKGSDGQTRGQNGGECPAGTEDVTKPDPFARKEAPAQAPAEPAVSSTPPKISQQKQDELQKKANSITLKWLVVAFVFGIIGKLMKKSFVLWFILGAIFHIILVAANITTL